MMAYSFVWANFVGHFHPTSHEEGFPAAYL